MIQSKGSKRSIAGMMLAMAAVSGYPIHRMPSFGETYTDGSRSVSPEGLERMVAAANKRKVKALKQLEKSNVGIVVLKPQEEITAI